MEESAADQNGCEVTGTFVIDDEIYGDEYVTGHVEERSFNIEPCDEVHFEVRGNACPIPAYTVWTLTVECDGGGSGSLVGDMGNSDSVHRKLRTSAETLALERAGGQYSKSIQVFPNPLNDIFTITTRDTRINYTSVRVFDTSGKTILTKDMTGRSELRIDLSPFQLGVYFVEITDDVGNKVIERVLKID